MKFRGRLILAGILACIVLVLVISSIGTQGFSIGIPLMILTFLVVLYFTSDSYKEYQKRQADKRRQMALIEAENAAIRNQAAQEELGRIGARAEYNHDKMVALRERKSQLAQQKRAKEFLRRQGIDF